jgi:Fe-S cluster assembly protein SufD
VSALSELFKNPSPAELELTERYARLPVNAQRERNFEAFAQTGLPHRRVEAWKYSDLRAAVQTLPEAEQGPRFETPFKDLNTVELRFDAAGFHAPQVLPDGMRLIKQADPQALGGAEDTPVAALGAALASKPGAVLIEITKPVSEVIHLVFSTEAATQFGRVSFVLRDNTSLEVIESHVATGGFSSVVTEYGVQDGAELSRTVYQKASKSAVQVFTCLVHLNARAKFRQSGLGFGARLCRNETRVFHHGAEASARMAAAYLLGDGFQYDQTSLVRHSKSDCATDQLVKGAVMDGGRAVFQGKFYVARSAQKTAAQMAHNALILENGGEVNAKPELEIYADDVECAHGNTVGELDSDALFYLRQRGLPERQAKALLTEAFIIEALESAPESVRDMLIEEARLWLMDSL